MLVLLVAGCTGLDGLTGGAPDSGASPPPSAESATQLAGDVEIQPLSLDFPATDCGKEAKSKTIVIRNTTNEEISFEASIPDQESPFVLKGDGHGTIRPGASTGLSLEVTPKSAGEIRGSLLLAAGKSFAEIPLRAVGQGAVIEANPIAVDFGEVRRGTTAPSIPITFTNTGSLPAKISSIDGKSGGLELTLPAPFVDLASGATTVLTATFAAPSTPGTSTALFALDADGAMCAAPPSIKAQGKSIDATITISSADFGNVACNSSPAPKEVTISNYSPADAIISSATFPPGGNFVVTTAFPLSVPKANGSNPGTAKLGINLKSSMTLGSFENDLVLSISGEMRTTKVRANVQGAILEINPPSMNFVSNGFIADNKNFAIRNVGNAEITVAYDFVRLAGPAAWFPDLGEDRLAPNATGAISVGFRPPAGSQNPYRATLTPRRVSGATICSAVPVATANGTRQ